MMTAPDQPVLDQHWKSHWLKSFLLLKMHTQGRDIYVLANYHIIIVVRHLLKSHPWWFECDVILMEMWLIKLASNFE